MNFKKVKLMDMERCYAVTTQYINGRKMLLAASNGKEGCYAFDTEDFSEKKTVWEEPGGVMSIVAVPATENQFLAIVKFYSLNNWDGAEIVWITYDKNGNTEIKTVLSEPYIHRFDVIDTGNGCTFIGCSLAAHKDAPADWSQPGKIIVGNVNRESKCIDNIRVIKDDIHRNHGFCRCDLKGKASWYIGCEEGVFVATPPLGDFDWTLRRIADFPTGEVAVVDIDADGKTELVTIEPFHGSYVRVYKGDENNWQRVYELPLEGDMYHALWGGTICGKPAIVAGCKRAGKRLSLISFENGEFTAQVIDSEGGPNNVNVFSVGDRYYIAAANGESADLSVYSVEP